VRDKVERAFGVWLVSALENCFSFNEDQGPSLVTMGVALISSVVPLAVLLDFSHPEQWEWWVGIVWLSLIAIRILSAVFQRSRLRLWSKAVHKFSRLMKMVPDASAASAGWQSNLVSTSQGFSRVSLFDVLLPYLFRRRVVVRSSVHVSSETRI
jgi:hypothetical protein